MNSVIVVAAVICIEATSPVMPTLPRDLSLKVLLFLSQKQHYHVLLMLTILFFMKDAINTKVDIIKKWAISYFTFFVFF